MLHSIIQSLYKSPTMKIMKQEEYLQCLLDQNESVYRAYDWENSILKGNDVCLLF